MLKKINLILFCIPILLFSLGFITLLSTSSFLVRSHVVFFLIGLAAYVLIMYIDYSDIKYFSKYLYLICTILLILTLAFAKSRFGATRWIQIGSLTFQTSEFAKLVLIITLAGFINDHKDKINELKTLVISALWFIPLFVMVLIQPDMGTAIVLFTIFVSILFFAGVSKYYFISVLFLGGVFSTPLWHFLKEYQKKRILVFLNPQLDILGSGYNVIQSLIAVGSGGLMGKGFGRGTQANLQFLPAHWTDFIFASFAEEWGFVGVFILIVFYTILLGTILHIAYKTTDYFGKLICIGVFSVMFIQFTVNVGMNLGIMPVTGVTLPLVSYGGSSLLFTLVSLGLVQNIWIKNYKRGN